MMSVVDWLLNPSGLTAHGFCLSWAPGLIALHAGSDAVVGLSYFSIPLALAWFVRRRPDLGNRWMVYAFAAFILACGTTHFFSILTLWVPAYGVEGLVKLLTAALSVATAAMLWPLIPRLVALPSPAQLGQLNAELSGRIGEQERTAALLRDSEARTRAANADLERHVVERTGELSAANATLADTLVERDRALQALAVSEAQFRAGFDGAAVGIVLTDPQSRRIVAANRAFTAMLGYAPDDLNGRDGRDVVLAEDLAPVVEARERLLSGETAGFIHEARCLRRDGTALWTRISLSFARNPQTGQPLVVVALVEDIDARYRAEAELRALNATLTETLAERDRALQALGRSEAEFRASFEAAPVGAAVAEYGTRRILKTNRALADILGWAPEELLGHDSAMLIHPEDRPKNIEGYARLLAGAVPAFVRETRCLRRDGTEVWTRIRPRSRVMRRPANRHIRWRWSKTSTPAIERRPSFAR